MAEFDLPTNFTTGANQTATVDGIGSMFQYANYALDGYFGLGIIFIIFIMSFGVSALMNIGRAFASASFITFVFSIYLVRMEVLTPTVPFVLLIFVIFGFFWAKGERNTY